jgi:hypothetical protein
MSARAMEKSGTVDGIRWTAGIDATSGGEFTIAWIDVQDASGKALPRYQQRTASHDSVESAVGEAEQLARSIARTGVRDEDD